MKPIIKVNNKDLSFRLKLNYNNVYSRLMMLLGRSENPFADISTKSVTTIWYAPDDFDYVPLSEVPRAEESQVMAALGSLLKKVRTELSRSQELSQYAEDIVEVPDESYVFYRETDAGYKFLITGWGCRAAHSATGEAGTLVRRVARASGATSDDDRGQRHVIDINDTDDDDVINPEYEADAGGDSDESRESRATGGTAAGRMSDDREASERTSGPEQDTTDRHETNATAGSAQKKKKEQHVMLQVFNQNGKPVEDEDVKVRTEAGEVCGVTDEQGLVEIGNLPYHSTFWVSFPNLPAIQERAYEVEPKVETYEAHIKKYVKYSPVLFVEDQNGNAVSNYNIKVVIGGQDTPVNSGSDGMVQLPTMHEEQRFIVIDAANYANSEEYVVTSESVKTPYRFRIKRTVRTKVGITVVDKDRKPIEGATVDVRSGDNPCQQTTGADGRAEFPPEVFSPGEIDLRLYVKGKGLIDSKLNYEQSTMEYTIQVQDRKHSGGFNWKWLLLLPLLLLIGGGAYWLMRRDTKKIPTIAEMENGVVMIYGAGVYYCDLKVSDVYAGPNQSPLVAYFVYDKEGKFIDYTFDETVARERGIHTWSGTGFLVSDDGLIATNKHVADPTPPEELAKLLKNKMQEQKDLNQQNVERLNDELQQIGGVGGLFDEQLRRLYVVKRDSVQHYQEQVRLLDKILNTGDFAIHKEIKLYAAFTGSRVYSYEDLIPCSPPMAVGEPGGVEENDVALIRVNKKHEIPSDAFVFEVPENDLMDGEVPDNYEITVLGYNAGPGLQRMNYQDAIKPQAQHGKISDRSKKYVVGYDAPTLGGSSGSPVVNNKGELVAINNSGLQQQGFNYGVRTKYLKELLDQLKDGKVNNKKQNNDNK